MYSHLKKKTQHPHCTSFLSSFEQLDCFQMAARYTHFLPYVHAITAKGINNTNRWNFACALTFLRVFSVVSMVTTALPIASFLDHGT